MPCIVPSHQAPALLLKSWRPHWFSGLALVLGSLAPDLEFIVPIRKGTVLSHTLPGQVLFTLPVVLLLYVLSIEIVLPWLAPYLPEGCWGPDSVRRPSGLGWLKVASSAILGGLTHIALDGFTHGAADHGWAVAFLPSLSVGVLTPVGVLPVHDLLQAALSLLLGIVSVFAWRHIIARPLWCHSRGQTPPLPAAPPRRPPAKLVGAMLACGGVGALGVVLSTPRLPLGIALELASYGFLDGIALGLLVGATRQRFVTALRRVPGRAVSATS